MNDNFRILVVEDEEDLNEILQFNLESEGYLVDTSFSAEEALKRDLTRYDLMILDVMMGKISGFGLAQRIRKEMRLEVPIIFLTARDTENDLLTGFNLGADDYMTKPFSVRALQARIKAVLKRIKVTPSIEITTSLNVGEIVIDFESKRLIIGDKKIELTRKEYEIICLLAKSPGRIFSREEILRRIWESDVIVIDRTVDVNMTRLRRKMEKYGSYIRNKPGFGYYFEI
ncbi:MAG TPA: response regulator transcription factor [Prolixibacteraceae bacterium]|nr:response regulator transcription factor [Prolixibacteraceae bacterium]